MDLELKNIYIYIQWSVLIILLLTVYPIPCLKRSYTNRRSTMALNKMYPAEISTLILNPE